MEKLTYHQRLSLLELDRKGRKGRVFI